MALAEIVEVKPLSKNNKAKHIAASAPIDQRALLTRRMACDYLSIGGDMLRSFESTKDIKGIPIGTGRELRFRRRDLDALIDAMEAQTTNLDKRKRCKS